MSAQDYLLTPRDPVVLGDGRPIDKSKGQLWPVPATLAAALNGWIGRGQRGSNLRGPLLYTAQGLFAPPPHDALHHPDTGVWHGGKLEELGQSVLWPEKFPKLSHLLMLDERIGRRKLRALEAPVCLDHLLTWALGQPCDLKTCAPALSHSEVRPHVALSSDTLTAEPGLLFSSPGVRLAEGASYAFSWSGADPSSQRVSFGADGRVAELQKATAPLFPAWSSVAKRFDDQVPERAYLRVQLLTPGLFDQEADHPLLPAWLDNEGRGSLPGNGVALRLIALRTDRYRPFSGWKIPNSPEEKAKNPRPHPREVRRLVPAGAVYWFGDGDGAALQGPALLDAAERLWLSGLDGDTQSTRLGFALALPGFTQAP